MNDHDQLQSVARAFAAHPDVQGKQLLQRKFMSQHKSAKLMQMVKQKGMPSVMPTGISLQQHSAQSWPETQAAWLAAHPVK